MNQQVLVQIFLPAAGKSFELMIPQNARIKEVQQAIAEMLSGLSDGMFLPTDPIVLMEKSTGQILNIYATVAQLGIQQGARLVLV